MTRQVLSFSMLAVSAVALAAAASAPALAQQDIKIGFVTTTTTPAGAIGRDMVDAVNLAIEHAGGRIAGRPIKLIVEDDGVRAEMGKQKVDRLLKEENVDFIAGFIWSDVLLAATGSVFDAKKFLISTNAGPSSLAGKDCNPNFFTLRAQNDVSPMALGEVLNQRGVKKLYALAPNYAAGQDMVAGVKRTFKGQIAGEDFTKWGAQPQLDFQAELAKAKAAGADAIFAFFPGRAGPAFLKQYEQSGLAKDGVKLFTVYTIDDIALPRLKEGGVDVMGQEFTEFWTPDLDTPANKRFVDDFRRKHNRYPSFYAAGAYDLIPYLKAAIEKVGGDLTKTNELRQALREAKFDSVRGAFTMGPNHFPVNPYYTATTGVDAQGNWFSKRTGVAAEALADPFRAECKMSASN
jgi:branched-chain amino acid transport system substrate-binding protein